MTKTKFAHRKIIFYLIFATIFMFFFGYALVPLYNLMCTAFGINGKTSNQPTSNQTQIVDPSRSVQILFVTTVNANLPWDFYPLTKMITIHPGQKEVVKFYAKNLTGEAMSVQAIPSVSPGLAAKHIKKTECFCFTKQTLLAHQSIVMPVIFYLDADLPKEINRLTLSYTLFKVQPK